jgi:hypothetical protein
MSIKKKTVIWTGITATVAFASLISMGIEPFEMEATEVHREAEDRAQGITPMEQQVESGNYDLPRDSEGNVIS